MTERIGLVTNVLLEPLYPLVPLAKVTASLDQLSAGRLTLGVGVGGRPDDYELAGRPFGDRGRRLRRRPGAVAPGVAAGRSPAAGSLLACRPPGAGSCCRSAARPSWLRLGPPDGERLHHRRRPTGRWPPAPSRSSPPLRGGGRRDRAAGRGPVLLLLGEEHTETSLRNLRSYYGFLGDWAEVSPRAPPAPRRRSATPPPPSRTWAWTSPTFDPTVPALDQVDRLAEVLR